MTTNPASTDTAVSADARLAQASADHRAGRLAEAAEGYRGLLAENPAFLPAAHGLGMVSLALGDADAAVVALMPAASARPMNVDAQVLLARALCVLQRWKEAQAILVETTAAFPNVAAAWSWRGVAAWKMGLTADAEASWREALKFAPNDPDVLNYLAVLFRRAGRLPEAADAYRAVLAGAPDHAVSHSNLGNVLENLGDRAGAEFHLRRAVALNPDYVDGFYNLGGYFARSDQPEAAAAAFREVIAADPKRWDALTSLAGALVVLGELVEAETCYRAALALKPDHSEAHHDLALLLLLTGRWAEGWAEYEWRWKMPSYSTQRRSFKEPLWDGRPLAGPLYLQPEQGRGDAIQFVRYARLAAPLCERLIIEAPYAVVPLLRCAVEAGLLSAEIVRMGDPLPAFSAHAPLMSLPRIFGTTPDNVPAWPAYLAPPKATRPELIVPYRGRRRIGLVWAGSPQNPMDRRRSMPAAMLRGLMDIDADFISLQVGPQAGQVEDLPADRVTFRSDGIEKDFADNAAVIAQLDLVIGVDTAVMHVAGAIGKPAWLLLSMAPDYRWLASGETTPWYPSMRLFRQSQRGGWAGVLAAVAAALARW